MFSVQVWQNFGEILQWACEKILQNNIKISRNRSGSPWIRIDFQSYCQNCGVITPKNAVSKICCFLQECISGLEDFQIISGLAVSWLTNFENSGLAFRGSKKKISGLAISGLRKKLVMPTSDFIFVSRSYQKLEPLC
jgi:hypothetical protein